MTEEIDLLEGLLPVFSRIHPLAAIHQSTSFSASANPEERKEIEKLYDLDKLQSFKLKGMIDPTSLQEFTLTAVLKAKYTQLCSVTLEPIENQIEEEITRRWSPEQNIQEVVDIDIDGEDPAEPITDKIDLGDIALEAFYLLLDPYAKLDNLPEEFLPEEEPQDKPFAALAALKAKMQSDE